MEFSFIIGGVDYTDNTELTKQTKMALDEGLDLGSIRVMYIDREEGFEPFTLVELSIKDDIEKNYKFYISSDTTEKILSTGKTNHTLVLIEEAKAIERLLVSKTTTNPLTKDIGEMQAPAPYNYDGIIFAGTETNYINVPSNYVTPIKSGNTFVLSPMRDFYEPLMGEGIEFGTRLKSDFKIDNKMEVISPNGQVIFSDKGDWSGTKSIYIKDAGQYSIKYTWKVKKTAYISSPKIDCTLVFLISFVPEYTQAVDKTITMVVESLLNTCETIRKGDIPLITFNQEQAEQYRNTLCPEMSFPKQTLWEALRQVGGVIHSIPRIKDNVLYFDSYDSAKYSDIKDKDCISETGIFDIEQYCSTIESSVDNLIAMDNSSQGAIEDYGGLFKTIRTEENTYKITESNCYIETSLPIGKILKVEVGYLSDGTYVGDITPYIFERAEYEALSSYDETYPTSKAFAIYYKLGEKHIGGLSFKVDNAVSEVFEAMAIKNIIEHKLGKSSGWFDNLFSTFKVFDLQFRVTYQPYYSATLRQVKPNLKDLKFKSVLSYTQGANSISTTAYGEHLKGVVSRLGTPEKRKTYILKHLSEVPNAGDKYDKDYRISEVNCEYHKDYILCDIGLSKKFNRWNNYVGVDNELRMYEVSNTQVSERPVIWEDYAVIQRTSQNEFNVITKNKIEFDDDIVYGYYIGGEYIYGYTNYLYLKDEDEWTKFRVSASYVAMGRDYKGDPLLVTLPETETRFGNIIYYNEEGQRVKSDEINCDFGANYGNLYTYAGITHANDRFYAVTGRGGGDEFSVYNRVFVGRRDAANAGIVHWEEDANHLSETSKFDWLIATIEKGEEQILVAYNKYYAKAKYYKYGETTDNVGMLWVEQDVPALNIDEYEGYPYNQLHTIATFNVDLPIGTRNAVFIYSRAEVVRGYYNLDTDDYGSMVWEKFQFPTGLINSFGYQDGFYIASDSRGKIYCSLDMITWLETEIAEKGVSINKFVAGEELMLINGTNNVYELDVINNETFLTKNGIYAIANGIMGVYSTKTPVLLANAKTFDRQEFLLADCWFSTIVSGIGNTMQIQFEYNDNYSAGSTAQTDLAGASREFKTQTYVPYGDLYGEAQYLEVSFFNDNPFEMQNNYSTYLEVGDNLPLIDLEQSGEVPAVLSTKSDLPQSNDNPINLYKDSREKIKFSYNLHFVTNDDDIIIGSGLAQLNALAMGYPNNEINVGGAKVYILPREIKDFEKEVDLTGATLQENFINVSADLNFGKIRLNKRSNNAMLADGKAWVIIMTNPFNTEEHVLLFGKNVEFKAGDLAEDVWADYEIAFTHKVEKFL